MSDVNNDTKRRLVTQLPAAMQSDTLKKFFSATVDHLFQPGMADQLSGYIGEQPSYYDPTKDFYISEPTASRTAYQLEPIMVSSDSNNNITNSLFYEDIVNQIRFQGGLTNDHNRLFDTEYYSWAPAVDLDKLMNYKSYYWIENGSQLTPSIVNLVVPVNTYTASTGTYPVNGTNVIFGLPNSFAIGVSDDVVVKVNNIAVSFTRLTGSTIQLGSAPTTGSTVQVWRNGNIIQYIIGQQNFTLGAVTLTNGMTIQIYDNNSVVTWDEDQWDTDLWDNSNIWLVEGVGTNIVLLDPTQYFLTTTDPKYIVIERGGTDFNPWARTNNWYHVDTLIGSVANYSQFQATRPILEFYKNTKLFNYGINRRPDIAAIIDYDLNINTDINGQVIGTVIVHGYTLKENDRILMSQPVDGVNDPVVNNLVFKVNVVSNQIVLTLEIDVQNLEGQPQEFDILRNSSTTNEYWFNGTTWVLAQTYIQDQQEPLFDLFDNNGVSLNDAGVYPGSNFAGNKLFSFARGTGINDSVLNFPLSRDDNGQIIFNNNIVTETYTCNNGPIIGFYYHQTTGDTPIFSNDWYLADNLTTQSIVNGSYQIPLNLQANPNNDEVTTISSSQWYEHFASILENQVGFTGQVFAVNNWYTTPRSLNVGTTILQHRSPMLKLMLLNSNKNIDFMMATRYVDREYTRFKNKFIQKINEFATKGILQITDSPSTWVLNILNNLKLTKNNSFPFRSSLMGGDNYYIPPTPAYLGMTQVYTPEFFVDDTYTNPVNMIRGHDGSLYIAYNDYRDNIILQLENSIYDSINIKFRTSRPIFDIKLHVSGKYRLAEYSYSEFLQILTPIFDRWCSQNQLDFRKNTSYDPNNPFTWNYSQLTDSSGSAIPGHWRGIYNFYYDTDRPHTHPWEMLGFSDKPSYWDTTYGAAPYTSGNTTLWDDIENGYIAGGISQGTYSEWARPNLIIPVDTIGNLLDPVSAGIVAAPTYQQASQPWKFGDGGPVENKWINSESYNFALVQAGYLMKPAQFVENNWDTINNNLVYSTQWINSLTGNRPHNSGFIVHGEGTAGNYTIVYGLQQFVSDYLLSNAQDITTNLGNPVRGLNTQLGHKMAGFTTADNMRILADNFGLVPSENITIQKYTSPSIKEDFYSGVIVEWTGRSWRVYGYDILNPTFQTITGDQFGPSVIISINDTPDPVIYNWRPNTYYQVNSQVLYQNQYYSCAKTHTSSKTFEISFWNLINAPILPQSSRVTKYTRSTGVQNTVTYATEFYTQQEVANFLFDYERYLVSRGWVFDSIDDNNNIRDWTLAVKEFIAWTQIQWQPGNFIAISPSASGAKYVSTQGTIQNMEQFINGVYPLLDRAGRPIDNRTTYVNRLNDVLEVVPQNNNIFAARLYVSEIEHVLIFSNVTIFNDIIYQPLFNLRQPRLRMLALRSQNWNGRVDAPGYILSDSGSIISNFEKTPEDIRNAFEIEETDNKTFTDYARHVVGYETRDYLQNLLVTETPQFEFYQGMIQQKGAPGVFTKLLRSNFVTQSTDLVFLEEWAFKVGEYGATDIRPRYEFSLQQSDINREPQLIQFIETTNTTNTSQTDIVQLFDVYSGNTLVSTDPRWVVRPNNPNSVFPYRTGYTKRTGDYPTAGYVRLDEVAYTAINYNDITNVYNNLVSGQSFGLGQRIWVYDNGNSSFDVLRVSHGSSTAPNNFLLKTIKTTTGTRLVFQGNLNLNVGDIIVINGSTRTLPDYNGVLTVTNPVTNSSDPNYQVAIDIPGQFIINNYDWSSSSDNPNGDVAPEIFVLRSMHTNTVVPTVPGDGWINGDIIYVDNYINGNQWEVFQYNSGTSSFASYRIQPHKIDSEKVYNGLIYDSNTRITTTNLEPKPLAYDRVIVYDPIAGIIPGVAARELAYQHEYDPAYYNMGVGDNVIDNATWDHTQIGQLWWDLSTVKYLETELNTATLNTIAYQNELNYRIANWGQIAPGTSIDIYEWTRSTVPPSQWAALVASSTIYYGTPYSTDFWVQTTEFDPSVEKDVTVYYFWVKGQQIVPSNLNFRNISATDVAEILTNPTSQDIPWLAAVGQDSIVVSGIYPFLEYDSVFQFTIKNNDYDGNVHKQWELLRPGDEQSQPNDQLWRKMKNSLVGRDELKQIVPDPLLSFTQAYGNSIRPRQSWFSNKWLARETFINTINNIFAETSLIDQRPTFLSDLTSISTTNQTLNWTQSVGSHYIEPLPLNGNAVSVAKTTSTGFRYNYDPIDEYSISVNSVEARDALGLTSPTHLNTRVLLDGINNDTPQWSVWEYTGTGYDNGFILANMWDFEVTSFADRNALITASTPITVGQRVLVDGVTETDGFWTLWVYLPSDSRADDNGFVFVKAQTYRTTDFFNLANWYATGYDAGNPPTITYATINDRNKAQNPTPLINFVIVQDDGTGHWIWTFYDGTNWNIVAKQNATLELSSSFYDSTKIELGFETTYNQYILDIPNRDGSRELEFLIDAFRDSGVLIKSEINQLFFSMIYYVHSEQDQVDWAFKTSFMYIGGYNDILEQNPVATVDQTQYLLDFIDEVKPYRVKIRDFVQRLNSPLDVANVHPTDFDKPVYYDPVLLKYRVLDPTNSEDLLILRTTLPWSEWYSNYTRTDYNYINNYNINAFNPVRRMNLTLAFDRVACGPNNSSGAPTYAAERINDYYSPTDGMPEKNISELMGCDQKASLIDGNTLSSPSYVDIEVDGGTLVPITTTPLDINISGTGLIDPYWTANHPEELIPLRATNPIVLREFINWVPGAPRQYVSEYIANTNTTFYINQIAQRRGGVAVFKNGLRQSLTAYSLDTFAKTVHLLSSTLATDKIETHSFGVASENNVLEQRFFSGDGTTTSFAVNTHNAFAVNSTINGLVATNFTYTNNIITFTAAPALNAEIMITLYNSIPTTVNLQAFVAAAHGTGQTFTLTNPSGNAIPVESTMIVEINGLRSASPEAHYIAMDSNNRIFDLDQSPNVNNVYAWINNIPAVVGTAAGWNHVSDINLNSIPPLTPSNANFVLVDYAIVLISAPGSSAWDVSSWDTQGWDEIGSSSNIILQVKQGNDWYMNGSVLTFNKSLNVNDNITVTTFQGNDAMGMETKRFFGNNLGEYLLDNTPYDLNYLWVNLNGLRLTNGIDYTLTLETEAWDDIGWDTVPFDVSNTNSGIVLNTTQTSSDIVAVTSWSATPNTPPVAFNIFGNNDDEWEYSYITDGNTTYLKNAVDIIDINNQYYNPAYIDLIANPIIPTALLPSHVLDVPDEENNIPGVVWINGERITYFGLQNIDSRTYRISRLVRGSEGTSRGIPLVTKTFFYQSNGVQTKWYVPFTTDLGLNVSISKYSSDNTLVTGYNYMTEGVDYITGTDVGGFYIQFTTAPAAVPTTLMSYDTITSENFQNIRVRQITSNWNNNLTEYSAGLTVYNAGPSQITQNVY